MPDWPKTIIFAVLGTALIAAFEATIPSGKKPPIWFAIAFWYIAGVINYRFIFRNYDTSK